MSVRIRFLGGAGTVTGSKFIVFAEDKKILVDAGLFQGRREWRERNWHDPEVDLKEIDAVLLTHAHIDHVGILPRYHALGLHCPVYCSKPTKQLAEVLLPDSGYLQEEEAQYRSKKKGRSRHSPPLPLYTQKDAESALGLFRSVKLEELIEVLPGVNAKWTHMGHILGACSISLEVAGKKINFSGDIGRYDIPILRDPKPVELGDLLLIESTYGNREHPELTPKEAFERVINETSQKRGVVLIPSFAVGRTQLLLFYIRELKDEGKIPNIPVIIDSPMATDATGIYRDNPQCYDEESLALARNGTSPFTPDKLYFTKSRDESVKLNRVDEPMILISASGMLTGGRILHHLKHRVSSPLNTVLFVGYQPPGGRGDWMLSGAKTMKIFGQEYPIRANVEKISGFSAHGDRSEMLRWCKESSGAPGKVAIVHGEPESAEEFKGVLTKELGWNCFVADYRQEIEI